MKVPDGVSIAEHVARAAVALESAGLDATDARQDAGVLARHLLRWDLAHWLGHQRDEAPGGFESAFAHLVGRRAAREPVAYITGEREFYGRPFSVSPAVLIPRPETELLIDAALKHAAAFPAPRLVDVGTGSGCIAVTIAAELSRATVVATDISAAALEVAAANAARHGVADRIEFRHGAFFAGLDGSVDMVLSNPPYVSAGDRAAMAPEVEGHEPNEALFSGGDGLDCVRSLIALAPEHLRHGGVLIFEFGYSQAPKIKQLIACQPALRLLEILPDLQNIPRVAVLERARGAEL